MNENLLMPQISVILPAYNAEKYLREAIDSILAQTYTNFELLVINDGSTDKTEEIILSYSDSRIRYIKNEENLKLIKTLNKGIDLARGKYIARMDADDISLPCRLEKELDFMEKHPDISACSSKVYHLRGNEIKKGHFYPSVTPEGCAFCSIFRTPLSHPSSFFRTDVLRDFKYDESVNAMHIEAFVLWGDLALANKKMAVLNDRLLYYRDNEQSICHSYGEIQTENHKRRVRFMLGNMLGLDVSDEVLDAMYGPEANFRKECLASVMDLINKSKEVFKKSRNITKGQSKDIDMGAYQIKISTLANAYKRACGFKKILVLYQLLLVFAKIR